MTRQDTPEKAARRRIDDSLEAAGWQVQNADAANIHAGRGVAIREFKLNPGHGYADYLLYVDGWAVGVIERPFRTPVETLRIALQATTGLA